MEDERIPTAETELRSVIRSVIDEFMRAEQVRTEPTYKTELVEERRRREQLEQRVNELAENKRNKRSRRRPRNRRQCGRNTTARCCESRSGFSRSAGRDPQERRTAGSARASRVSCRCASIWRNYQ